MILLSSLQPEHLLKETLEEIGSCSSSSLAISGLGIFSYQHLLCKRQFGDVLSIWVAGVNLFLDPQAKFEFVQGYK